VFACSAGGPGFDSRLRRINRVSQLTDASEQRMLSDALCRGCRWPWSSPYKLPIYWRISAVIKFLIVCGPQMFICFDDLWLISDSPSCTQPGWPEQAPSWAGECTGGPASRAGEAQVLIQNYINNICTSIRSHSGFSRFPANESLRRTGLHLSLLAKSSFYLTAFEIFRSCRTASWVSEFDVLWHCAMCIGEMHMCIIKTFVARHT